MKYYKDLPREVVLNAPVGAMWANAKTHDFYRFEDGHLSYFYEQRTWVKCTIGSLSSWLEHNPDIIPLPNVKIPWEATQDSVSPVPADCMALVWLKRGDNPCLVHAGSIVWSKNAHNTFHSGFVTHYQIEDIDYLREESAGNGIKEDTSHEHNPKIYTNDQLELAKKLDFLLLVHCRYPLIADCAKAAMERLVAKLAAE